MKNTIVLAVGGTQGHIGPAKTVAKELVALGYEVKMVGVGIDRQVDTFSAYSVSGSSLSLAHLWKNGNSIIRGVIQSLRLYKVFSPIFIIGFGSYHSFPPLVAGWLKNVPYALYEPNVVSGRVNGLFAKRALAIFTRFTKPTDKHFPCLQPTKTPVSRKEAAAYYCLDMKKKTVLLFGGSQGAKALNTLIKTTVQDRLFPSDTFQLLHFTGEKEEWTYYQELYRKKGVDACVKPYEKEMHMAWSFADVAISRSGASSISEAIFYGVPTLFIPYPFALDNHQKENAIYVTKQYSEFDWIEQKNITPHLLVERLKALSEMPPLEPAKTSTFVDFAKEVNALIQKVKQ